MDTLSGGKRGSRRVGVRVLRRVVGAFFTGESNAPSICGIRRASTVLFDLSLALRIEHKINYKNLSTQKLSPNSYSPSIGHIIQIERHRKLIPQIIVRID